MMILLFLASLSVAEARFNPSPTQAKEFAKMFTKCLKKKDEKCLVRHLPDLVIVGGSFKCVTKRPLGPGQEGFLHKEDFINCLEVKGRFSAFDEPETMSSAFERCFRGPYDMGVYARFIGEIKADDGTILHRLECRLTREKGVLKIEPPMQMP